MGGGDSYADVPRRQRDGRACDGRPRSRRWASHEDHVLLVRLHLFIRSRTTIGPELAGFSTRPTTRHQRAHARERRAHHRPLSAIYEFALPAGRWSFAPDHEAYEREMGRLTTDGVPVPSSRPPRPSSSTLSRGVRPRTRGTLPRSFVRRRRWRFRNTRHGRAHPPVLEPGGRTSITLRARSLEGSVYHTAALHPRRQPAMRQESTDP
jgi:hypothetical protein